MCQGRERERERERETERERERWPLQCVHGGVHYKKKKKNAKAFTYK